MLVTSAHAATFKALRQRKLFATARPRSSCFGEWFAAHGEHNGNDLHPQAARIDSATEHHGDVLADSSMRS